MGTPGKEVTKAEPCPCCKKPDWCYRLDDGIAVNCKRLDRAPDGWKEVGTAKEGKIFRPIEQSWQKPVRPKRTRRWIYRNAEGNAIIEVYRKDDGHGRKKIWQKAINSQKSPGKLQAQAMPYRYQECLERVKAGERIFWVEGEAPADALWDIGIPATTTIRGSAAYSSEQYAKSFPKNKIVICPDRDKPGLGYASTVAQDYPEALWLYAFPDSPLWQRLNEGGGADIADWIDAGATADQIRAAVEPRRAPKTSDVSATLETAIDTLVAQDLDGSTLTLRLTALAEEFHKSPQQVEKIFYQRRKEADVTQQVNDVASDLANLVRLARQQIDLHDYLPPPVARAIHSKADSDRLNPARPMQSLLAASASQLGARLEIKLKGTGENAWTEKPIIWALDVGKASMGKTQCDRTITAPLRAWQRIENTKQKAAIDALPEVERKWKAMDGEERASLADTDANPVVYKKEHIDQARKYVYNRGTTESLLSRISEQPARSGVTWLPGEISSLVKDADRYQKSSSSENTFLDRSDSPFDEPMERRSSGNTIFFDQQTLCISGGTQPERVTDLLDPQNDPSGMASRWLMVMPSVPDNFAVWSDIEVDCYACLNELYNNLRNLNAGSEVLRCLMDDGAKQLFIKQWERYRRQQCSLEYENPGLSKYFGKCAGHLGRLALVLHAIEVVYGQATLGTVAKATMERAIKLLDYYIGQFRLIQIHCGEEGDSKQQLTGKLLNLRDYITRKDGLTTADLTRAKKGKRAELLPMLEVLARQGYITERAGKYYGTDSSIDFEPYPAQQSETVAKPESKKSEPLATDTYVEVVYPDGETPPPDAAQNGTTGFVSAVDEDKVTIVIETPPGATETPLGTRFKTVPRYAIKPLSALAS